MDVVYSHLCPICGKELTIEEINEGKCKRKSKDLCSPYKVEGIEEFEAHFGRDMRVLQRVWAKRVLRGESFAIEAPTGIGKSTFGIEMATFLSNHGKRCYIIVPTANLVNQTYEKAVNKGSNIIKYHKDLKNKEEVLERIKEGKFNLLITTSNFLVKHFDKVKDKGFDFIFVDDLDALLRGSKNVDKIIHLIFNNERARGKGRGVLVIATATTKLSRGREKLRTVLGIDASSSKRTLRNIDDYFIISDSRIDKLEEAINFLKDGIIVYTNREEEAREVIKVLQDKGFKVGGEKEIDKFREGEINVIVGVSSPYGKLVRGLDMPYRAKFSVFYGVPHFKMNIRKALESEGGIKALLSVFRNHPDISNNYDVLVRDVDKARRILENIVNLKEKEKWAIKGVIVEEEEVLFIDIRTYIQASGRTSRMLGGGLTKGISVVIDKRERIEAFIARASFYDIYLREWNEEEVLKSMEEVERSRREIKEGKEEVLPALMIVESPTKAKQISRFYGKPAIKIKGDQVFYEIFTGKYVLMITASLGHVVDLLTKKGYHGVFVDEEARRVVPFYDTIKRVEGKQFVDEISEFKGEVKDSKEIIENIRMTGYEEELIIIATDPDVEGEKIAYDISNLSGVCKNVVIKRAEFHEITKQAVDNALSNLRRVDVKKAEAQIVRRVEDRWIGFELSKKVQEHFSSPNLSAGRVQTPVLGWIIEAYEESKKLINKHILVLDSLELELENGMEEGEVEVEVRVREEVEEEITPLPPYTTDTILRDANVILKMSASETMSSLQKLFENGLITYHRTDSTRVSEKGREIAKMFLGKDFVPRQWGSGGAHECIRPTKPLTSQDVMSLIEQGILRVSDELSNRDLMLYDLIFGRFMASQSPNIKVRKRTYQLLFPHESKEITLDVELRGKAYELYPYIKKQKRLVEGKRKGKVITRKVSKRLPLTQAEVISMMKTRGIGRASTYAIILSKLFKRSYIIEKGSFLIPTKKGIEVYNFLSKNYKKYVSEETTRRVESIMKEVEEGKKEGEEVLISFYREISSIASKKL